MVERLLILKQSSLNESIDKPDPVNKNQSFNTDDDDSLTTGELSKSNENLLSLDVPKRSLLSLNSPSMDSVNDPDGSISDNPIGEKSKKKKRRTAERLESVEQRRSAIRKRPWYLKVDFTKPIICLVLLFLIYLMWAKRDVWIPRLLTSNSRVRLTALKNEERISEHKESLSTKNSSSSSGQDEIVNDNQNNDNFNNNNDLSSAEDDDDDDSPAQSSKQAAQKINIRIRRNKMSFSRDRPTKKSRYSTNKIIDDDDDEDEDDAQDNDYDDNDSTDSTKSAETIPSSSTHASKRNRHRHHHVRPDQHQHKTKSTTNGKSNVIIRPTEDIVEQLKKLIKSQGKNRDILALLTKETGLTKAKLNRFIQQKDLSVITLDNLISILDSFDSTILIVSK